MNQIRRILIPFDKAEVATAIEAASKVCEELSEMRLTLFTETKDFGRSVEESLGDEVCKKLSKGNRVPINKGFPYLSFQAISTLSKSSKFGVILAAHISRKKMDSIDSMDSTDSVRAIIYLARSKEAGENWGKTWNAEVHGEQRINYQPKLNSEVEAALRKFSSTTNGYGHISDKLSSAWDIEAMVKILKDFRRMGIEINPEDIRIWAIRDGWSIGSANQLTRLAEKYSCQQN